MNPRLAMAASFAAGMLISAMIALPLRGPTATVEEGVNGGVDAGSYEGGDAEIEGLETTPDGGVCPQTKKGGGFGSNSVECRFSCSKFDVLYVEVHSSDTVPVFGSASCGGASATCHGTKSCTGVGGRWASSSDDNGVCRGTSDETWKSAISANCWGAPGCTNPLGCAEDATREPDGQTDPA